MAEEPTTLPPAPGDDEGQPVQITLPALSLMIPVGTNVGVQVQENGDRLIVIGPMVLQLGLPFNEEGARKFARDLTGGIALAHDMSEAQKLAADKLIVRR